MRMIRNGLLSGILCLAYIDSEAVDLTGSLNSHDPALLIQDGDTCWYLTTGDGI